MAEASTARQGADRQADSGPGAPDRAAEFNRLFGPHLEGAAQLARCLISDPLRCERALREGLDWACRHFETQCQASSRAWLLAAVRRSCRAAEAGAAGALSLMLSEASLPTVTGLLAAAAQRPPGTEVPCEPSHRAAEVRMVIDVIPEPFREAVVLKDLQHLSFAEFSEVTGLPVRVAMARLGLGRFLVEEELLALQASRPPRLGDPH